MGTQYQKSTYNKYENLFRWAAHKLKLQEKFERKKIWNDRFPRGSVYACYLGENIGDEKSKLVARPCLIVSTDGINYKSSNIIVIPLSKNVKYKNGSTSELKYSWHYVLKKSKYTALNYDSAVQCEDIRSISKARVGKFITKVDVNDMNLIRKRLKSALQI